MKKTIEVTKLADFEVRRFAEIEFYLIVQHLIKVMGHRQELYELIEVICNSAEASISTIKLLVSNLGAANSIIRPSTWELMIIMYRADSKIADIVSATGVSHRTIYRKIREYNEKDDIEAQFMPRVRDDNHEHIVKFNKKVKELMKYDGYRV